MNIYTLFLMVFCHIVADFNLQGIMSSMKQKGWWKVTQTYDNEPCDKKMYRFDYIAALIAHSFHWAFLIMLPIAVFLGFEDRPAVYGVVTLVNTALHAIVDDLKANRNKINLITDQVIHLIQILITWAFFM